MRKFAKSIIVNGIEKPSLTYQNNGSGTYNIFVNNSGGLENSQN